MNEQWRKLRLKKKNREEKKEEGKKGKKKGITLVGFISTGR